LHINKLLIFGGVVSVVTSIILNIFSSGKIIDIPKGTPEGGIIAVVGSFLIVVSVVFISVIGLLVFSRIKKLKKNHSASD